VSLNLSLLRFNQPAAEPYKCTAADCPVHTGQSEEKDNPPFNAEDFCNTEANSHRLHVKTHHKLITDLYIQVPNTKLHSQRGKHLYVAHHQDEPSQFQPTSLLFSLALQKCQKWVLSVVCFTPAGTALQLGGELHRITTEKQF
jgi:hypothetical protein